MNTANTGGRELSRREQPDSDDLTSDESRTWAGLRTMTAVLEASVNQDIVREAGMPLACALVLGALEESSHGILRIDQIAAATGVPENQLGHLVERLETSGWAHRSRGVTENRQPAPLRLTISGRRAVLAARPRLAASVRRHLIDRLDPAQQADLRTLADAVLQGSIPGQPRTDRDVGVRDRAAVVQTAARVAAMATSASAVLADGLRKAFRHHPTGIAVITARDTDGTPTGLTASSVASVSLAPPAIVFSVTNHGTGAAIRQADTFLVHLLDAGNSELAQLFATPGTARFGLTTRWTTLDTGEPWLTETPAALRCRPVALTPIGTSTVITAEVIDIRTTTRTSPALVHHDRGYYRLRPVDAMAPL
jgi:flavin reductase (DIM6/NTAB) family NADH-FMN oxidoreductase RutF/DNA-binding MarR family transcriptional regulator